MSNVTPIKFGEFCKRVGADERAVRYVLERGFVPDGVKKTPATGNHRTFDPGQAFWLAMVLKLMDSGVKTPLAALMADYAEEALRGVTQNLSWDWRFLPAKGWFDTEHLYFVEVGDLKYVRLVTDACPSKETLYEFDWHPVEGRREPVENAEPFVTIRLDLTRIARVFRDVPGWICPL
jgi:hypothetical protein